MRAGGSSRASDCHLFGRVIVAHGTPGRLRAHRRAAVAAKLAGDWPKACAKFDASMQLDPSPSTLLNVAECLEHDGKLARARLDAKRLPVGFVGRTGSMGSSAI